jgi:hypothetical protein
MSQVCMSAMLALCSFKRATEIGMWCTEFSGSTSLMSVPNQKMHTRLSVIYFWRRKCVTVNTLLSPHKLILYTKIYRTNKSYQHTFVCHCHFMGQNYTQGLLSTIYKAYFPSVHISNASYLLVLYGCFISLKNLHCYLTFCKKYLLIRVTFTLTQDTMNPGHQVVWHLAFFEVLFSSTRIWPYEKKVLQRLPLWWVTGNTLIETYAKYFCVNIATVTTLKPITFEHVPYLDTSNGLVKDIFCHSITFLWKQTVFCSHWITIILV